MKKLTLIILCGLLLTGCGVVNSNAVSTIKIGVPTCDEYLSEVEIFLQNPDVPQPMRATYKQSLEQNRTAWKQAIATEQGRQQLESSCKTALDSAKPALMQYGQK